MNDNCDATNQPSAVDALLDAVQDAIVASPRVFVRPSSRAMAAKLRYELFGESEPAMPTDADLARETGYQAVVNLALNVMVGLVHRRLAALDPPPGADDAFELVATWLDQVSAGSSDEAAILSSLHLALRARPHLGAATPAVDVVQVPPALWRSVVAMLARAAPPHWLDA